MNKRQILASLSNIANELDNNGLYKEATSLTKTMIKIALDGDQYEQDLMNVNSPSQLNLPLKGHSPSVQHYIDYRINNDRGAKRPNRLQQMIHREEFEHITEIDSLFNFVFTKGTMPRNLLNEIFTNETMSVKLANYIYSNFPTAESRQWWKLFFEQYTNEINAILDKILVNADPEEEEKMNGREKYLNEYLKRNVIYSFSNLRDTGILPDEVVSKFNAIQEYELQSRIQRNVVDMDLRQSPQFKYLKENEEE
jgi:hypothetical protein